VFSAARVKTAFNMHLSYDDQATPIFEMPYSSQFDHGLDDMHGGVIATLLDNAGWFAAAVHYDNWIYTSDLHTRFLEPANHQDLRAVGRVVRAGLKMAITDMEVRTTSGRLVAVATGSFVVTNRAYLKT
jgi:uncharacterized protein (TIGR00369 family)